MKWKKLGRVFAPDMVLPSKEPWMTSHAYLPTPILVNDIIRVYIGSWDGFGVKRIGFVDVSADDPTKILEVSNKPCLDIGGVGTFDEDGVCPSFASSNGNCMRLYYVGWQLLSGKLSRYIFMGVATSWDGGISFRRLFDVPLLDRTGNQRFIRSSCSVLKVGDLYYMWYTASDELIGIRGNLVPSYKIYTTSSKDGLFWLNGMPCLEFEDPDEFGLSRPWVVRDDVYKMFYSIRKIDKGYTIGYAESIDGNYWERKDHLVGIGRSIGGWDSEMICFPAILDYNGNRYMFYNGNDYGRTGFGVAVLEEE